MAVADVVLNHVLKDDFLDHVREIGYELRQNLLKNTKLRKFAAKRHHSDTVVNKIVSRYTKTKSLLKSFSLVLTFLEIFT